ncbi:unnamed protein product [Orchesella dallaii]|uniref:Uncharacterized protein n=1 Tax=Orchesella dallaii TaxID=48710 RepID=A0ABP1PK29_9HEXA
MKDALEKITRYKNPRSIYSIDAIISDYKKLKLICDQQNQFLSYRTLFLHGCGYLQFIADVFLAVQVLRLDGTGIMDIWFFIEDSLSSMYMIYRVYNNMSKVSPASENFFSVLKRHLSYPNRSASEQKRLIKVTRTLRMVKIRVGPCIVVPATVLGAMDALSSYYIVVALWK